MDKRQHLIWIDLEMTGLVPESDRIIEIATIVTNVDLQIVAEGPVLAIHQSNAVLAGMGADIQWVHSYVAGDKIYCIYNAPDEQAIREHAEKSGFPANRITPVSAIIDPSTASG